MANSFRARIFLMAEGEEGGHVDSKETWDDDLTPMNPGVIPVRDWAKDYLDNLNYDDYVKEFKLSPGKDYEVVLSGSLIPGQYNEVTMEYGDDELDIDTYQTQELPTDYFGTSKLESCET